LTTKIISFPTPQNGHTKPMDDARAPSPVGYSAAQAAKLLDLPIKQIRDFVAAGFITPRPGPGDEYRFSFQDLVLLRTAKELTQELTPRKVKRALSALKDRLPQGRALSAVRLAVEGDEVVVRDGRETWNPESGQTLIDFQVSDLAAEIAPLAREQAVAAREGEHKLTAEDWYELGCDLETHEPDEARDAYRRSLELNPRHPDAHLNLGRLLHEAEEVRAAEAHYRLALLSRPQDPTAAYNLGVSLQDLGQYREALKAYGRAIHWDPDNADAHHNLAQIYEEIGQTRMALRHFQIYRGLTGEE
jgi:tetratricopeptide (TPR) repeat protein